MSNLRRSYGFALLFNLVIIVLTVLGTVPALYSNFNMPWETRQLTLGEFFFSFSNIANLLYGFACLLSLPFIFYCIAADKPFMKSRFLTIGKFALTANLLLVSFVSFVYLLPTQGLVATFWSDNHFFYRALIPFLALISEIFFENRKRFRFRYSLYSFLPIGAYSIFYIIYVLIHTKHNVVAREYDPYGFCQISGVGLGLLLFFVIMASCFLLSSIFFYLRNRMSIIIYGYEKDEGEDLNAKEPDTIIPEDEDNEEILSDKVLGRLGDENTLELRKQLASPEKKQDGPTSDTMDISLTYTTDTGTVHLVTKRVKRGKFVLSPSDKKDEEPEAPKVYHIYHKFLSPKWILRASDDEHKIGVYPTPADALEEARKIVRQKGGSIKAHYTRFSPKAY